MGHAIDQHHHGIADQHHARVTHREAYADGGEGVEPVPVRGAHQYGTHKQSGRHQGIRHQVQHRTAAVEIVIVRVPLVLAVPAMAKQAGGAQVHRDAGGGGPGHWATHQLFRILQPLQGHHHHG